MQNFRSKNNTLEGNVWLQFSFNFYNTFLGLTFKGKNYYFISQNCVYSEHQNRTFKYWNNSILGPICVWFSYGCHLVLAILFPVRFLNGLLVFKNSKTGPDIPASLDPFIHKRKYFFFYKMLYANGTFKYCTNMSGFWMVVHPVTIPLLDTKWSF